MDFYEQKGLEKVKVIERCLEKKIFEKGSPCPGQLAIWPATADMRCVCTAACLKQVP